MSDTNGVPPVESVQPDDPEFKVVEVQGYVNKKGRTVPPAKRVIRRHTKPKRDHKAERARRKGRKPGIPSGMAQVYLEGVHERLMVPLAFFLAYKPSLLGQDEIITACRHSIEEARSIIRRLAERGE